MNLFADLVQPMINWLQTNPHWALFFTFLISLTESLAVIGSIVPGSVTMTAIGIMAGSGIMRIDLTLLAAILGAVCGDSLSYALGYIYSDQLVEMWPFSKYPNLLKYGKDFFTHHGGKSVLIGRFIGPLRSIIPVIAGIMQMKQWQFLTANIISAIGWSLLYVIPGVLIGTAGHELSSEAATRLFLLILFGLLGIWLLTIFIKSILGKLRILLKNNLHYFWIKAKNNFKICNVITPLNDKDYYATAGLALLFMLSLLCFIVLYIVSNNTQWLDYINFPVNLFTQSVHTPLLEAFFIVCTQLTSTFTLICLFIISNLWFLYQRTIKDLIYLYSLIIFSTAFVCLFAYFNHTPRPQGLMFTMPGSSFPAINIAVATSFYGFATFYINNRYPAYSKIITSMMLIMIGLSGFATIYLGDYWLTDVFAGYLLGIIICLVHWQIYRTHKTLVPSVNQSLFLVLSIISIIILTSTLSTYFNFKSMSYAHRPFHKEFILTTTKWWDQQKPILPLYRLNRVGKRVSLLNIQYDGDLGYFELGMKQKGWELNSESFLTKLIMSLSNRSDIVKLPLLTQLYENKHPELIMTYKVPNSILILELTIWESNYNLDELYHPLWIGTIHQNNKELHPSNEVVNALAYLVPALESFTLRRVTIPANMIKTSTFPTAPYILLIQEP